MKNKIRKICLLVVTIGLIFTNMGFALEEKEVLKIDIKEAEDLALKNSVEKSFTEFQKERLLDNEDATYNGVNSIASNPFLTIGQKEDAANPQLDALHSIRMGIRSLEDAQKGQDILIGYQAKIQYITLLNLEKQMISLQKNLDHTEKLLHLERVKKELGLSNQLALENMFYNTNQLKSNLEQVKIQKDSAYTSFKKLLGISLNQEIALEEVSALNFYPPNYQIGLQNALENGIDIRNAQRDVERKDNFIDDLKDRYPIGARATNQPQIDLREAQLKLEDIKIKTELNYKTAYNDLIVKKEKIDLAIKDLDVAKKNLDHAKLMVEIGMTSKLEFEEKQMTWETKELSKKQVEYEYIKALEAYNLAREGIILSMN